MLISTIIEISDRFANEGMTQCLRNTLSRQACEKIKMGCGSNYEGGGVAGGNNILTFVFSGVRMATNGHLQWIGASDAPVPVEEDALTDAFAIALVEAF